MQLLIKIPSWGYITPSWCSITRTVMFASSLPLSSHADDIVLIDPSANAMRNILIVPSDTAMRKMLRFVNNMLLNINQPINQSRIFKVA